MNDNPELADQLREKAEFCLATGIQPSEYDNMTDLERDIFIDTWNSIIRKRKQG